MIGRFCLLLMLAMLSSSALAEYYVVYTPPQCGDCVGPFPLPHDYKPKYKDKHHARQPKSIAASVQRNACGECEKCICGNGYAVSTSSPQYDGEHCTTYDDELHGRAM